MTTTTSTDEIVFSTVPDLTTCSQATIEWSYSGTTPAPSNYPLAVVGFYLSQDRREYPIVPRQTVATVNKMLSTIDPSAGKYNWSNINVPQGQYRLDVYASAGTQSSNIFTVTNGTDISCLTVSSQSSIPLSSASSLTPTATPVSTHTSTHFPSSSTSSTNTSASDTPLTPVSDISSSVNKGAIAGGVVGAVVALVLIAAVVLWLFRRRKTTARKAVLPSSESRAKGQASKGLHSPSDSTGAILAFGAGNQESSPQFSTSEEDFSSEKSVVGHNDIKPTSPPIAATRSYSSASSRRPASMSVHPSFESRETLQSKQSRQLCRSLDSNAVPPDENVVPPSPSSPSSPRSPRDRTRRTSRKPVPAYDPNEFPNSGTDDIPLSGWSETSLVGGTKTYYLTPDVPLEQRK